MNIDRARQQMIEQQVRTCSVSDAAVLQTLGVVPREQFVTAGFESLAFAETALPIGHGQFMMTPNVAGRMLQALAIQPSDDVLEVGTGSGFMTACLARLARSVTSIDIYEDFIAAASANLADSGISNVEFHAMDATQQLPQGAFDVIALGGSIEVPDPRYAQTLKPGGRLFLVLGTAPAMTALLIEKHDNDTLRTRSLFETDLPALSNAALPPQFSF